MKHVFFFETNRGHLLADRLLFGGLPSSPPFFFFTLGVHGWDATGHESGHSQGRECANIITQVRSLMVAGNATECAPCAVVQLWHMMKQK